LQRCNSCTTGNSGSANAQLSPKALLDIDGFRSASDIAVAIHELQQLK
jgi:hypothetical protein